MPIAAQRLSFRVPESFDGPSRRELGALARYRVARLEQELHSGGAWLVELVRTADGFACRVTCDLGEGTGHARQAVHALDDAVSQLEVHARLVLGAPAPRALAS